MMGHLAMLPGIQVDISALPIEGTPAFETPFGLTSLTEPEHRRISNDHVLLGAKLANMHGAAACYSGLGIKHIRGGRVIDDRPLVSRHVVTTAGVDWIKTSWLNTTELEVLLYHASGTGTTAESAAQTALVTETGTRVAGTASSNGTGIVRIVATISYSGTLAITEHGIFSQLSAGGTMWDRSLFTAVNVINGDSIQFTYDVTFSSGG